MAKNTRKPKRSSNPLLVKIGRELRSAVPDPVLTKEKLDQLMGTVEQNDFAGTRQAFDILYALLRLSRHQDYPLHVDKKLRDATHLLNGRMGAYFRQMPLPLDTEPIARATVRRWGNLYGVETEVLKAWLEDRSNPASEEHVRNWRLGKRLKKVVPQ